MPRRLALGWLVAGGLAAGAWWGSGAARAGWVVALPVLCVSGVMLMSRRAPRVTAVAAATAACALGFAGAALRSAEGAALERAVTRTKGCSFVARVLEQSGGLGTLVALEAASCSSGTIPAGNVFWDASPSPAVGSKVRGWGWLTNLGDDEFARARREAGGRALLIPVTHHIEEPEGFWGAVASVRQRFREAALSQLTRAEAALLLGLTVGDTDHIDESVLSAFRAAGLSHLLAVSGSNVAIVLGAVAALTRRAAYVRRIGACLCAVVAFVAIVGPDGSVLRAAVMGTLALVAGGWIRPIDPARSLPFAILVLVAARPSIATSAGLHLSAAATLGIVLWSKGLAERLGFLPGPVAAPLGVTLAAQAAVAPLLVLLFGRVSLVSPLTNLLVAPAVVWATVVGMVVATVAPLSPNFASLGAGLASPALRWLLFVAEEGASLSWSEAEVPATWGWLLGAAVVGAVVFTLRKRPA